MNDMEFQDPSENRLQIEYLADKLVITVPSRRSIFTALFMIGWLGAWTVGGYIAAQGLLNTDGNTGGRAFIAFWLVAWLAGELLVSASIVWMLFGSERITASLTAVTHSFVIFFQFRKKRYLPAQMTNLRWMETKNSQRNQNLGAMFGEVTMKFEYGPKTVSLVRGVDKGEADFITTSIEKAVGRKISQ